MLQNAYFHVLVLVVAYGDLKALLNNVEPQLLKVRLASLADDVEGVA
jgi:hypothetical protein